MISFAIMDRKHCHGLCKTMHNHQLVLFAKNGPKPLRSKTSTWLRGSVKDHDIRRSPWQIIVPLLYHDPHWLWSLRHMRSRHDASGRQHKVLACTVDVFDEGIVYVLLVFLYVCMYVYIYIYANKLATPATPNYSRIYCHHWMWASLRAIAKLM